MRISFVDWRLLERLPGRKNQLQARGMQRTSWRDDETTYQVSRDLPPCTRTVVTCSRPPRSTIARCLASPLVSYVKMILADGLAKGFLANGDALPRLCLEKRPKVERNWLALLIEDEIFFGDYFFVSLLFWQFWRQDISRGGWFVFISRQPVAAQVVAIAAWSRLNAPRSSGQRIAWRAERETLRTDTPRDCGLLATLDAIPRRFNDSSILSRLISMTGVFAMEFFFGKFQQEWIATDGLQSGEPSLPTTKA